MVGLEALHQKMKPSGIQIFWTKTKEKVFVSLLMDDTVQSVHTFGDDTENMKNFAYFCSVVQKRGGFKHDVFQWTAFAYAIMDSFDASIKLCRYPWKRT